MSNKKIYGLVLYTYDYYEWQEVLAVSENRKSLQGYLAQIKSDEKPYYWRYPFVPKTKHEENQDTETPHFVIEVMNYVK